ncbi:MAG: hybrid sensor histidine kinase/response regulator [Planctomycetaceae bacterium]|nr:hybrid sensor histidine kinase/response regulator [Planctomycetaceae bacterium]
MPTQARILIVDDSPEDCVAYQRNLERGGRRDYSFEFAHSATRGLELCRSLTPDCVLLDFNLPDGDGLDFMAQLHSEHGTNSPPVIMVTGQGNESVAVQAMKSGAQDYLVKGAITDTLLHSIQNAIQYASLKRQVEAQQREVARLSAEQTKLVEELRHHTAELSEADRRKNEFLAVLAHELRNPLGPIRNAAHIIRLSETSLSPDGERAREIIERQVGHMAHLIDDLLDVSRIVRGKVLLHKEPIELVGLVRSVLDDHGGEFKDEELTLSLKVSEPEIWIDGDSTRVCQILGNILDNARKFTPTGGTISVSMNLDKDSNLAVLKVKDSGEGIEPAMIGRMFEVFSQADRSLDRTRGGLGLGLAIVKGLAELHGGNVLANSQGIGQGCEIVVRLPATTAPVAQAKPAVEKSFSESKRILVVEDNLDAAETLSVLLQKLGHTARVAHTGQEALRVAHEFLPELVLCDIGLSDAMTGYVVAQKFKEDPALASIYLIALTGYGQEIDQQQARDAGFDLHLTKPIAFETLRDLPARSRQS